VADRRLLLLAALIVTMRVVDPRERSAVPP
jgi:hypothetical protein